MRLVKSPIWYILYPLFVEKIYQGLACETVHSPASMSIRLQSLGLWTKWVQYGFYFRLSL